MRKGIIALVLLALVALLFMACNTGEPVGVPAGSVLTYDREGFPVTLPEQREAIISIGPSNTEILVALGFGEAIVQADMFSADVDGIRSGISTLDMFGLDLEYIISLAPDVVFITGMTRTPGAEDPLHAVSSAGISVIYMPISASIAEIQEDIRFIAAVLGVEDRGEAIAADMMREIETILALGETITERRSVYFEISPPPHMVSFGTGTFLHEMIEIIGAVNVFADQAGWFPVSGETLVEANPDVILTSVDFLEDPVGDIMNRPGWTTITAVHNGEVFRIDANTSSRPSHNIVAALWEMARAVYPDVFR